MQCSLLKRRQIRGPEPCALVTAHVLVQVVAKSKWRDVDQLLDRVFQTGRKLVDAQPQELVLGNIVRRVQGLIWDEAATDRTDERDDQQSSMANSVSDLRDGLVPPAL
ncbi:GCD complex subunit gcd7, partial [Sporothrix curviconia]